MTRASTPPPAAGPRAREGGERPALALRAAGLLALLVLSLCARLGPRAEVLEGGGVAITDRDTLRRLARLHALDRAESYPIVEPLDGWPQGTTIHWTLPMDGAIRLLDALLGWVVPGERGYEGGAVLAGPVLALGAVLAFVLLAVRLLGFWPAIAAGAWYALAYPFVATSSFGNGDHQTLQQLAGVFAVSGFLLALQRASSGAGGALLAGLAGSALGFAVWVSTEVMLLVYALVAALLVALAWPRGDERARRRLVLPWSGALLGVVLAGALAEQSSVTALCWDAVSLFHGWQAAALVAFGAALRLVRTPGPRGVLVAGVLALALAAVPFALGDVRAAVAEQVRAAGEVRVWLHAEVSEFRGLFQHGFGALFDRDGLPVLCVPLALVALPLSGLAAPVAAAAALLAVATFGLYVFEVKLGPWFALVWPLVLAAGSAGALRRFFGARAGTIGAVGAAVLLLLAWSRIPGPRAPTLVTNDRYVREICAKVAAARARVPDGGVLAPWDMGAALMYHAGVGVVASGYHRNFAGIRDGFRFWLADAAHPEEALAILRARRVRWVVAWYSLAFLDGGARILGRAPLLGPTGVDPAATRTMFWQLRYGSPPGFRLLAEGPAIRRRPGDPGEPLYRLWEVVE
ncbi:MAG TPA: hypothetical protein VK081_09450 [Planctomycetota bacterium]|nr:hypothetical protein [Planctomycetota bacterium]